LAGQAADKCACAAADQRATQNAILPPIRTPGERQCHRNHDKTLAYLILIPIEAKYIAHGTDPTNDNTHDQTPTLSYRIYSGVQRQKNTADAEMHGAWPPLQTFIADDLWLRCFPRGDLIEPTSVGCVHVGTGNFRIVPSCLENFRES
jgi:hypothetical protein